MGVRFFWNEKKKILLDTFQPGARRFDMGEVSNLNLIMMAEAGLKQVKIYIILTGGSGAQTTTFFYTHKHNVVQTPKESKKKKGFGGELVFFLLFSSSFFFFIHTLLLAHPTKNDNVIIFFIKKVVAWGAENTSATLAQRTREIAARTRQIDGMYVSDLPCAPHFVGIRFEGGIPSNLIKAMRENQVFASVRGDCIRVSVHLYNTDSDVDKLFGVLEQVLRQSKL